MKMQLRPRRLRTEILKGAVAGAVATWTMGAITSFLYEQEDSRARRKEKRARRGKTPYGVAAERVAEVFGQHLDGAERERLGATIHWALGIGTGALYAAIRNHLHQGDGSHGLAMGATFWGLIDEGLNPALGLTPGPDRFPWQAHIRGLTGHLSYGVVTDSTLRLLDRFV